jgi:hypothetical protein
VRERRPLREARRARRVLDVDRVVELERLLAALEGRRRHPAPARGARPSRARARRRVRSAGQRSRTSPTMARSRSGGTWRARKSTLVPDCSEHVLELRVLYAGLMLTRIAPMRAAAYCTRTHSCGWATRSHAIALAHAEGDEARASRSASARRCGAGSRRWSRRGGGARSCRGRKTVAPCLPVSVSPSRGECKPASNKGEPAPSNPPCCRPPSTRRSPR